VAFTPPRAFGGLLIDCEEDRTLPAVLVGMLRENERRLLGALHGGSRWSKHTSGE
jgi:hypothetical protein